MHQDLGPTFPKHRRHVHRVALRGHKPSMFRVIEHMRGEAVENRTHLDGRPRLMQLGADESGVVRRCEDGLGRGFADLAAVDVKRRHQLDVKRPIRPDRIVHEAPGVRTILGNLSVVLNALEQAARTVADPGDRDFDLHKSIIK